MYRVCGVLQTMIDGGRIDQKLMRALVDLHNNRHN